MNPVRTIYRSATFYPVSTVYLTGSAVAVGITAGWFSLNIGLVCLTAIAIITVLTGLLREVRIVHHLVNSQRDELLARISDLVASLNEHDITLPPRESEKETSEMKHG